MRDGIAYFEVSVYIATWNKTLRVVFYRKPVHHQTKKNYQLDLFDPTTVLRVLGGDYES
jgi:hypothetical protein